MALNTGALAGKTIFISGASRGIGLSIAKKAAQDGANIVIAAKTAEPHPKLPGTIYTAAKEIEDVGGKCLPCIVDIQNEEQVQKAVNEAVQKFGGIDILVNNASAIHLTGTEATPMKRYDLMHQINTRGTFLCSKICVPHLKQGRNPHILNISPPLNMHKKWFQNHVAYTMAKYGMTMCALGMSEEFKPSGIAVNTLWPRTGIYTAAMAMLGGGEAVKETCRKPEIMSDAAYVIFNKDSKLFTGNFLIDDDVLKSVGVTNFDSYAYDPSANLLPDFFVDGVDPETVVAGIEEAGGKPAFEHPSQKSEAPSSPVDHVFNSIKTIMNADMIGKIGGVFEFDLKDSGNWYADLKNGSGAVGKGSAPSGAADVKMICSGDSFVKMFGGKLSPTAAYMTGKLKIKGDLAKAMKLERLMKEINKSKL